MKPRPKCDPFTPGWKPPAPFLDYLSSGDFQEYCNTGPKQWTLDGIIAPGEFSVVYGDPDAGKGNFVTTLACAVAGGQKFFGRQAGWFADGEWLPCGVLYLALERSRQVHRRIVAYGQEKGAPWYLPIVVSEAQFDIRDESAASAITETLYEAYNDINMRLAPGDDAADFKPDFNLIIIDTLSMALQGGSDSDPEDLGKAIHTIKTVIRETDAHVMLIHHSPVSGDNRMRGYGTLNAAIDVSIRVERKKGYRVASVIKNSDGPDNPRFYFDLKSVDVPQYHGDRNGERIGEPFMVPTPLLVEMDELPAKERAPKPDKKPIGPKPSKSEQPVYDALAGLDGPATEEAWRAAYDDMREDGITQGNHRTRFSRGKASLEKKGLIKNDDGNWSVTVLGVTA